MDDHQAALKERLARLLKETAEVQVQLSRLDGSIAGIPHYSLIESQAHELGRRLSRETQQQQMTEMAASAMQRANCPSCGTTCELQAQQSSRTSIDGPLVIQELQGHCPSCRRNFFPSSRNLGI